MSKKEPQFATLTLEKIVGGGQALGTLDDGRKAFVWGGLPGEQVTIRITKKKSKLAEGVVAEVITPSPERIVPTDPETYLSTSPWQIMTFAAEQHYKAALIEEAFELHNIVLPEAIEVYSDEKTAQYRNKMEFSWFGDTDATSGVDTLDLAFFVRGSKGKFPVHSSSLAHPNIMALALAIRDILQTKQVSARSLKTLLVRSDQAGNCTWQLYVKDALPDAITASEAATLPAQGGEIIYSNPKSPASVITERLASFGNIVLTDTVLGVPFRYATEGFFQVNIPVYEQALRDMQKWVQPSDDARNLFSEATSISSAQAGDDERGSTQISSQDAKNLGADSSAGPVSSDLRGNSEGIGDDGSEENGESQKSKVLDLYSGVGSIGLTIGGDSVTLVEINEHAVREMRENIARLGKNATAVLAPSEKALEYITGDTTVIVDPPRAGLHADVVAKLLEAAPSRIIYLSCNPVTQARDVALLAETYGIRAHRGYNFFPRTPHIEHLVVLDKKA